MALTKWNQVKKSTKSNSITFSIVIGFYIVVQLLAAAGVLTNSFSGQLVPICAYVVMAVSLNLVVGFLGEPRSCRFYERWRVFRHAGLGQPV